MGLEACIFDLDGVLVDTAKYHFIAWKKLANTIGFDFTEQQNQQLKGVNRIQSLKKILSWADRNTSEQEQQKLAQLKNTWYVEMISGMGPEELLPGVPMLLETLRENNIKIALGSASKNAQIILQNTGITHYFDAIIDGNVVQQSKPNPEVFIKGAQSIAKAPSTCVVFEDASAGVEAALRAGMRVIGIGAENELSNAHLILKDLKGINLKTIQQLF